GLNGQVKLLGHRTDVEQLLAAADVFVFPSRFEGLPGALIEAAAAGLPIIASDIPNNREVAGENKNALFFPVNDHQVLSACIEKMATDPDLRSKFAKESLRIFNERFTLEKVHEDMREMMEQLTFSN
ncbi:MAG: glycosyltransferase, partial [Cyclobacteriaceae bacterium]|nr:glycosyltransferase [Cyclobacteriaceae bacterium]